MDDAKHRHRNPLGLSCPQHQLQRCLRDRAVPAVACRRTVLLLLEQPVASLEYSGPGADPFRDCGGGHSAPLRLCGVRCGSVHASYSPDASLGSGLENTEGGPLLRRAPDHGEWGHGLCQVPVLGASAHHARELPFRRLLHAIFAQLFRNHGLASRAPGIFWLSVPDNDDLVPGDLGRDRLGHGRRDAASRELLDGVRVLGLRLLYRLLLLEHHHGYLRGQREGFKGGGRREHASRSHA
mmetsp:Transcript_6753/g.15677  ORF Transcript_6753/g.15677 Transcript_6753/m.15677 type:complete len:239 (+) Transcript_6753:801-1517(+)